MKSSPQLKMVKQLENGQPKNFLIGTVINRCYKNRMKDFDEKLDKLEDEHNLMVAKYEKKRTDIVATQNNCMRDFSDLRSNLVTFGCFKKDKRPYEISVERAVSKATADLREQFAVNDEDGKAGRTF